MRITPLKLTQTTSTHIIFRPPSPPLQPPQECPMSSPPIACLHNSPKVCLSSITKLAFISSIILSVGNVDSPDKQKSNKKWKRQYPSITFSGNLSKSLQFLPKSVFVAISKILHVVYLIPLFNPQAQAYQPSFIPTKTNGHICS